MKLIKALRSLYLSKLANGSTKAIMKLEYLVEEYGKTIQKLERTVAALEARSAALEARSGEGMGLGGTGHALEMNSFYVDRFPHHADEFEGWDKSNLPRLNACSKDREWHNFYDTAMALLVFDTPGDYYEFGCCGAGSMRMALAKSLKWHIKDMDFYAFDSFQGFPTTGELTITEEDFIASIHNQGIKADRVTTIPGFYDQSLTKKLQQEFLEKPNRPIFINIDCDLHESAVSVFEFIEPLVQPGTILYLDDFWRTFSDGLNFGTALAFNEYCEKYPRLKFYPFMRVGSWGMSFIAYDPKVFTAPVV
ncbi:MAG: hypothetical protein HOI52_00120 [Rhodospirillales bacterium]|jgi:hypothetical protein|nr:hypothetical protein [Rhodospirillales bacterium]MBT5674021.1 hypothetical protein [Rhodospirillales bacterium]MBT6185553.1 hypothetical protein [Rhodospirillales bacterium]MBT6742764.1 hypothetical protein [Rhodospirillales bacterium]MBT7643186.1 hypothetical protein [Rhodospirillales bacterium]